MAKHYTMWIKSECPFCIDARDELFKQRVNHTIYIMDDLSADLERLKETWNHSTVPIVAVQNEDTMELLGGYTDLVNHFDAGKSDD